MPIHAYDNQIFSLIRDLFAAEDNLTPAQALEHYSDERLKMVRTADSRLFQEWTNRANAFAQNKAA